MGFLAEAGQIAMKPLVMRTAAGAAGGFFAGRAVGDRSAGPDSDYRPGFAMGGAILGAAAGAAFPYWSPLAARAGGAVGRKVAGHFEKMPGQYAAAMAELSRDATMKPMMRQYRAISQSYMSMPLMLGGGALLGMAYADHHGMSKTKGAAYGLALGAGVKGGAGIYDWWKEDMSMPGAKLMMSAGVSAGLLAHGAMNRDMSTVYSAEAEPMTGRTIYGPPQSAPGEEPTIRSRMDALNASGDLVFGMHNRRH